MNKAAIKNFAVWARRKLMADITYKAGLIGITETGIAEPLPQSTSDLQFFDIGTKEYATVTGKEISQRDALVRVIRDKEKSSDYVTAFNAIIEEVAYTWFNRLIAIRFMEVNDYLPSRIRVLSSENPAKNEPDFVTTPFDTDMEFTATEQDRIIKLKDENKLDELFRMLFIKQCNKLHEILPELFEKTNDYTELLLSLSFTDKEGIVYHLTHDIEEDDFNVEKKGQVEIIGWMYQYYNIEPKDETFALLKKNVKITKERIPAATQLFTPDWIVRYMVENSLGRLWVEGHPNERLKENWKYYLEEAEQETSVQTQLDQIRAEYRNLTPEDIKVIDPCMGSGHILVYCFDVLMQIYESQGYTQRDAAQSIVENNLFGLDIDKRAAQLAYFAVMMKARQYDRRIFTRDIKSHVYAVEESNGINRVQLKYFGADLSPIEKSAAMLQITGLLDTMIDSKEYGSILNIEKYDWELIHRFIGNLENSGQLSLETMGIDDTRETILKIVTIAKILQEKYDVVITNPPYMASAGFSAGLDKYVKDNYGSARHDLYAVFIERNLKFARMNGFVSMITQHTWMFTTAYTEFRRELIRRAKVGTMLHLGAHAFDEINGEVVQTTAFVLNKSNITGSKGLYFRLTDYVGEEEKRGHFLQDKDTQGIVSSEANFEVIDNNPFAYWASKAVCDVYRSAKRISDFGTPKQGLATGANDIFLRAWFEVPVDAIGFSMKSTEEAYNSEKKYFPYNKGGENRKWYGNDFYVVNWENDGFAIKHFVDSKGKLRSRPQNLQYYFKPCCTWSLTSSGDFAARFKDYGNIFDINGMSLFSSDDIRLYLLGFLCSPVCTYFMKISNPSLASQSGDVARVPFILDKSQLNEISQSVSEIVGLEKDKFDEKETSWNFTKSPLV